MNKVWLELEPGQAEPGDRNPASPTIISQERLVRNRDNDA